MIMIIIITLPHMADAQQRYDFVFVGDSAEASLLGLQQGLKEANLQGQFLGQEYHLDTYDSASGIPAANENLLAIFVASNAEELGAIQSSFPTYPVFNLVLEDDELRARCMPNVLHVIASNKMREDAVQQWQQKNPASSVVAQTWHGDFVKFAARDLNKRYRKAFDIAMDDHAWAGWAAIKMSSDAIARNQLDSAPALLAFLKNELAFDGQKGINMTFRETGQLRQPMLIVEGSKLLGEAPVRGISSDIDSLGLKECVK